MAETLPKILAYIKAEISIFNKCLNKEGFVYGYKSYLTNKVNLHPTNITHIVKIFSASVFGATLPNPTEVKEVNVKYSAVIYRD